MIFQKVKNTLSITVDGAEFLTARNIEFYVRQGSTFFEYIPEVISDTEIVVTIPYEDAMKLSSFDVYLQLAYTDSNGNVVVTEKSACTVSVFLKEAGYDA